MILTRAFLLQTFVVATCAAFGVATLHAQSAPAIDNCKAAAEYSHSQHGTGVLVMVRGEIVFEDYAPGWTADKPHLLASGTKSFCGVMAACALHDGLLTLDEKVAETLTEWKNDQRKSQITVRQLLSLSSGIGGGDNWSVPSYKRAVSMAYATAEAGKKFSYGPIPFQCFGELMQRTSDRTRTKSCATDHSQRLAHRCGLKVVGQRTSASMSQCQADSSLRCGSLSDG